MAAANFTINGESSPVSVEADDPVTLALTSTTGVRTVQWTIVGGSDSTKSAPTITPVGIGLTATLTMNSGIGGVGLTWLVMCIVNGGVDDEGQVVSAHVATGIFGVENSGEYLPIAYGEHLERNPSGGYTDDLNAQLAASGGGGGGVSPQFGVLHVAATELDTPDGSIGAPYTTITDALSAATFIGAPYVIKIAPGVYTENVTLDLDSTLGLELEGLGPEVAIDGNVTVSSAGANLKAALRHLRVTGNLILDVDSGGETTTTELSEAIIQGNVTAPGSATSLGYPLVLREGSAVNGTIDQEEVLVVDYNGNWQYVTPGDPPGITDTNISGGGQYRVSGSEMEVRLDAVVTGAISGSAAIYPPPGYAFEADGLSAVHGVFIDLVKCPSGTLPSADGALSVTVIGQRSSDTAIDFVWPTAFAAALSSGDHVFVRVFAPWKLA